MAVNPPRPRMPPLNALRAFEAAARHESFAKAADELGVTPAAVSHQVKALEAWLGSALFARHAQGLHLTEAGRAALPAFSTAFDAMGLAVQELENRQSAVGVGVASVRLEDEVGEALVIEVSGQVHRPTDVAQAQLDRVAAFFP